MSDLMREEFETAMAEMLTRDTADTVTALDLMNCRDGNEYKSHVLSSAWWAWQASRERLVIELPDRFDEHYQDYYEDVDGGCFNEGRYINDVHAALTAAGVKYK